MTTSPYNAEVDLALAQTAPDSHSSSVRLQHRSRHTMPSRFVFLIICLAIILTALAFGTVHSWSLAIFSLGALGIIVLWLLDGWRSNSLRISRNLLQLPLLGMLLLGLVQLLPLRAAVSPGGLDRPVLTTLSLDPYGTRLVLLKVFALLIYFAAVLVFVDTHHRLRLLVRTIIIFGFFLAIFGLTQSITSPTKVYWIRELSQSTAFGPFINRHHFAGYMELTIALPLGLLFSGSIERETRFIYLFAAGLMGIALIMTNSRGGIISLIAEIMFLAVITSFRRRQRKSVENKSRLRGLFVKATMALALIVALVIGVLLFGGDSSLDRFVGTVNADDPTTGRSHFWDVTLDIIQAHPLLGTGLGAFGVIYTRYDSRNGLYRLEQAHNDYLQVLSDGGIIGGLLALSFVWILFRKGLDRSGSHDSFRRGIAAGALAGCFGVLVHSFFDFTLHTTSNALLFLVLAALATLDGRVQSESSRGRRRRRHHRDQPQTASLNP